MGYAGCPFGFLFRTLFAMPGNGDAEDANREGGSALFTFSPKPAWPRAWHPPPSPPDSSPLPERRGR